MKHLVRDTGTDVEAELATLREKLYEAQQRLEELSGGQSADERLAGSLAASATGIAVSTPHGRFLRANEAFCRMLGYTEEELRARNFASLTHPDDLLLNLRLRDELLAGERENFLVDVRYLKKSGDVAWASHSVSATRTPRGDVTALLVIAEDIAERKRTEDALRNSEERLRLITNLVPLGIFAKDAAGRHIFANPALAEMAGLSIEELLGKDDFDLVADKAEAEAYRADDLAVMESGLKMVISEETRTDFSGRKRVLQTIKIPFTVAETGEPAVLGVCMDITERKRVDARFRRLVDSNVQGVFFWKTSGEITGANDAFLWMVGYTREDLEAGRMSWAQMTPPELVERDQRALTELGTAGVCAPFEKEFIRRDGSRVPVLMGPAMFEDSRDEGFCFVLDLSESKKLEQQFLRAQRMESIGSLAGGVAHDLNNILLPIMLSIGILKREAGTPKTRAILETIADSAQRGADIVRQVLSYARGIEGQKVQIQPGELLHELENIIRGTFPKNIRLLFSVPSDIWMLLGDPTQVHQILLNLCVNARDAMPDGGSLTIRAENRTLDDRDAMLKTAEAEPGRYVYISVTDSGTGIPQDIIHKIFEPFFTTKQLNKGTGLGLSTVVGIVKSHKGIVNVSSEAGKGTTFEVYLPALEPCSETQQQPHPIVMPRGNGETILVVDDEPSILTIARGTLEAFGYHVLTAGDGAEAVAVYAENRNDVAVVLTDMMMPVMGGSSLTQVLLRINPALKIVRTSGLHSNVNGNGSPEAGLEHSLTKPYTAETLLTTIRAILEEA
jgi:PAS domain S-box-containing protein